MKYMKSKTLIVIILLLLILISVTIYMNRGGKENQPLSPPISEKIDFCKEGTRGNDCIRCSCNSAKDCKLVTSPYVISECAKPEVVSKSTNESCLDDVRIMAIRATCVVPEGYTPPEYEVVCINNTCGKIEK
jgi:hypothetical protein